MKKNWEVIKQAERESAENHNQLNEELAQKVRSNSALPNAMYLSKNLTSRSLPEIGRRFGNRDHTTVIHAVRKVEELRDKDASFDEDVQLLIRMLES